MNRQEFGEGHFDYPHVPNVSGEEGLGRAAADLSEAFRDSDVIGGNQVAEPNIFKC